jgi:hypothetical protein
MPRLAGWKLAENRLSRTFEFQDFVESLRFVNRLAAHFETIDHHPDVCIAYGEVTFEPGRYDLGGQGDGPGRRDGEEDLPTTFFSVWHPKLIALRESLGLPRHPAKKVARRPFVTSVP